MNMSLVVVRGRRWIRRIGLVCASILLTLCAQEHAFAGPTCGGVGAYSYDQDAIVESSTFGVDCAPIAGSELSMNGSVAPSINFGAPAYNVVTSYTYDTSNQILTETIPGTGTSTSYAMTYDGAGNLISETTTPSGSPSTTTTYTYDTQDRLMSETVGGTTTTTYTYDALDRLMSETVGGITTTYTYDPGDDTVTSIIGGMATTYTYDTLDRIIEIEDPSGAITSYNYDAVGNVITETDPNGKATQYQYDAAGDLISSTDPNGNTTNYTYNSSGLLGSSTDGGQATTAFAYAVAVPEPSSMLALAGGLTGWLVLGLGLRRRQRV